MSIDLSLDRIKILLERLPVYNRPTVHIAGTNGKGSVAAIVSSILSSAKFSVGRFNSPHLLSVNDCIIIDGAPVSKEDFVSAREVIKGANEDCGSGASSFELLTCTALYIFQHAMVDAVVLEVGLGGRLDATNAIPDSCVLVSALTAVDFDHQAFLGDTIAKIATEKAHIARKGKPFVIGPQVHPEAVEVAMDIVQRVGADTILASAILSRDTVEVQKGPLSVPDGNFLEPAPQLVTLNLPYFGSPIHAQLPLHGKHQLVNLGVAASIISTICTHPACAALLPKSQVIGRDAVITGVESVRWPGRLSFHSVLLKTLLPGVDRDGRITILADGAHNPASAAALATFIAHITMNRNVHISLVLALSHSPPKTPSKTLAPLFSVLRDGNASLSVANLGFSPVDGMPWVRPVSPLDLRDATHVLLPTAQIWTAPDATGLRLKEALRWSAEQIDANGSQGLVVLAGSLYLVADFYRMLSAS